jgi:hypothetical protein
MKPTAESRSCRSHARCVGVLPEGDHVRRHTGWSINPLSSEKTMGLPVRAAPFLSAANPASATAPWLRRRPRGHAAPASDMSIRDREAGFRRNPDDTAREIVGQQRRQSDDTSTNRCDSRPFADRPEEYRGVGVSASRLGEACGRDVVWLSRHPSLLSPQPDAIDSERIEKHQGYRGFRRCRCLGESFLRQSTDEPPTRLRFLSFSCNNIRIFTQNGSLATEESIMTAKLLGCSEDHVRRLHAAGKLCGTDISLSGRRACWRWWRSVVEEFIKSRG